VAGEGHTVYEAGLATGSDAVSNSEFASGSFTIGDSDGLDDISSITIGGTAFAKGTDFTNLVDLVGESVDVGYGTIELTNYNDIVGIGVFDYTYTLDATVDNDTQANATGAGYQESFDVTVSDGTAIAKATVSVDIVDDIPVAITPQEAYLVNQVGEMASNRALDLDTNIDDNYGADQGGTVKFAVTDGTDSGHATGSDPIYLYVSTDGTHLIGSTLAGSDYATASADITGSNTYGAFAVTLNPDADLALSNDTYDFELYKQIDGGVGSFSISDGSWDFHGGNTNYVYYTDLTGQGLPSVLVTPTGADATKVNATANNAGATGGAGGKDISTGEALRVDFVDNITGTPAQVDYSDTGIDAYDHNFDSHRLINGAKVGFDVNNAASTVLIKAYTDWDYVHGDELVEDPDDVGDNAYSTFEDIIRVEINGIQYTADSSQVTFNTDGTVTVSGIGNGDSVVVFTTNGFTTVEYHYVDGTKFSLSDFGASTYKPGEPINMNFDLEVTDADGDSVMVESAINVMISPDNHVIDEGTDGNDTLSADPDQPSTLIGYGGDDTLTGDSGDDILIGGEGDDTIDGGTGNDTIVFDAADSSVDGGDGFDTLLVADTGPLDFSNVDNIEKIDLNANDTQEVTLNLNQVLDMVGDGNTLTVTGGLGDVVNFNDGLDDGTAQWTSSGPDSYGNITFSEVGSTNTVIISPADDADNQVTIDPDIDI